MPTDRDDMFREEDREFLQAVATRQPVSCPISEARLAVEAVEEATKSAHRG